MRVGFVIIGRTRYLFLQEAPAVVLAVSSFGSLRMPSVSLVDLAALVGSCLSVARFRSDSVVGFLLSVLLIGCLGFLHASSQLLARVDFLPAPIEARFPIEILGICTALDRERLGRCNTHVVACW